MKAFSLKTIVCQNLLRDFTSELGFNKLKLKSRQARGTEQQQIDKSMNVPTRLSINHSVFSQHTVTDDTFFSFFSKFNELEILKKENKSRKYSKC